MKLIHEIASTFDTDRLMNLCHRMMRIVKIILTAQSVIL